MSGKGGGFVPEFFGDAGFGTGAILPPVSEAPREMLELGEDIWR
jgi:hypothetical protein